MYEQRLEEELMLFNNHLGLVNKYWQLQRKGHLLFPESSTMNSSLLLHLLDLNPMDPVVFDLPFLIQQDEIASHLRFYANDSALRDNAGLPLNSLGLLTDLYAVCQYLNVDLSSVSKKVIHETFVHDFIEAILENDDLTSRSYFLLETKLENEEQFKNCSATTFDELIRFVHDVYLQNYPSSANRKGLIGEIYMDVLRVGWIWWFGRLKLK